MPPRPPLAVALTALLVASAIAAGVGTGVAAAAPGTGTVANTAGCSIGASDTASSSENIDVSTWTAPGSTWNDLQRSDEVRAAIDDGTLTPASDGANMYDDRAVAVGDVVVHRFAFDGNTTGVLDMLAEQGEGSPTANFRSLVHADNGIQFYYLGPTACPPYLALNASIENDTFRVASDHDRDVLYLVLDVEGLYFELGESGPEAEKWNWGRHQLSFVVEESTDLVSEKTTVRDTYEVDDRRVEFDTRHDELLRFEPGDEWTVSGRASMAPGTAVGVELAPLETPDAPAVAAAEATITRDGSLTVTFEDATEPDDGVYVVRVAETPPDQPPYRLATVGNATGASLHTADHTGTGEYLGRTAATTTHGGFIVAENDTAIVAVTDYLEPGAARPQPDFDPRLVENQTLTVTVYRDVDADRAFDPTVDEPYRLGGEPVQETLDYTVTEADQQPPETTTTTTTTSTTTVERTTTTTATTQPTTTTRNPTTTQTTSPETDVSTPGFGALTVLLALVTGGLLARRH